MTCQRPHSKRLTKTKSILRTAPSSPTIVSNVDEAWQELTSLLQIGETESQRWDVLGSLDSQAGVLSHPFPVILYHPKRTARWLVWGKMGQAKRAILSETKGHCGRTMVTIKAR